MGYSTDSAALFSFLIAIPAIGGAICLQAVKLLSGTQNGAITADSGLLLLVGFVVSAVSGYMSLAILIKTLRRGKFVYFGYYCLLMSAILCCIYLKGL
jgi:undecaprenyl-diphosphatase